MDEILVQFLTQFPWLPPAAALHGFFSRWLQKEMELDRWGLLGAATGVALLVVGCFGAAQGWTPDQWRQAPLGCLLMIAMSLMVHGGVNKAVELKEKKKEEEEE